MDIMQNTTYITYLDESEDCANSCYIFSSISIPVIYWNDAFKQIKRLRMHLSDTYGLDARKELHARDFVNGRGRFSKTLTKFQRNEIFKQYLSFTAQFSKYKVFSTNACMTSYEDAFDRVVNRINTTLQINKDYGILIFDAGNEPQVLKTFRKMHAINYIPSAFGKWEDGSLSKNIPIMNLLGEASFRDSSRDYFIQTADLIAFSLLRREYPTPQNLKYGIEKAFESLVPILNIRATKRDPFGIVRK